MSFDYSFPLASSNQGAILELVQARIQDLALQHIPAERVVLRAVSWDANLLLPYVIVRPAPEIINPNDASNEYNTCNYAVLVSLVAANTSETGGPMTLFGLPLYWREQVRLAFQNKSHRLWRSTTLPLTGSVINRSIVMDGEPFIEAAKRQGYDAQYLGIRFHVTEPGGQT